MWEKSRHSKDISSYDYQITLNRTFSVQRWENDESFQKETDLKLLN